MNFFFKKRILVTGGSGSIGSEIVRFLIRRKCKVIRVLSNDENGIYELSEKINNLKINFKNKMLDKNIRFLIGDIRDINRCVLASKGIDIVIHAAALKHVPICEYNPNEAYKTNVIGTKNLIKSSIQNKVKKFLFISTDKAADPTSVMGKTKLIAENLVLRANKKNINTKFSVIRFGNILFSRGSVAFKFFQQARNKKNMTVTGLSVSRFFISIKNAVARICESLALMNGGEIFVVMRMKAFKIIDLARAIRSICGKKNLIQVVGLREGEKKYEKLISQKEQLQAHPKSKKIGVVIKNKKKIITINNTGFIDSRLSHHLNVMDIKKILLKEKYLQIKSR
jgi:UDP-N-acetylglucosamine 4,6-dehydratase